MIYLQTPSRYYNRETLLRLLRRTFGHLDFKIRAVGDAYFEFQAPRDLTPEEWSEAKR